MFELIKPFQDIKTIWQIRIEASRALMDLEFHYRGIDAALSLFIRYLKEEYTLRGSAVFLSSGVNLFSGKALDFDSLGMPCVFLAPF